MLLCLILVIYLDLFISFFPIYICFTYILAPPQDDPCEPSPCGSNAQCDNGICTCLDEFKGDPYIGCRPECVMSYECPSEKSCVRNRCVNPCNNVCGFNAICQVSNHIPICICPPRMTGDAFIQCSPIKGMRLFLCNTQYT